VSDTRRRCSRRSQAQAVSFVPFHRLEIVTNGRVVASREESSGAREMGLKESVQVAGPGWLAARCSSRLGPVTSWQFAVQAHTSPVYLTIPGQELLSEAAATYMLTLIDGAQTWAETLATRPDEERLKRMSQVFESARGAASPAPLEWRQALKQRRACRSFIFPFPLISNSA
jgi:hypothetical protein